MGNTKIEARCVSIMGKKCLLLFEGVIWLRQVMDAVAATSSRGQLIEVAAFSEVKEVGSLFFMICGFCSRQKNSYFFDMCGA